MLHDSWINAVKYALVISVLLTPLGVMAQTPFVPDCIKTDGSGKLTGTCKVSDFLTMLANIYNWLLGIAGLVAMVFLIWGGLRMMYWSFMENAPAELEAAKFTITRAITGIVIVLVAFLLVNTVLSLLGSTKTIGQWLQAFR